MSRAEAQIYWKERFWMNRSTKLSFIPRDVSVWKAAFGIDVREISALGCLHFGHLHLNVNFSDEDRHRFLEFEGQQPDLLNRIESK